MKRRGCCGWLATVVLLVAACGGPAVQSLAFGPAPWADGEVSEYALLDSSGAQIGEATWKWSRSSAYWLQDARDDGERP